MKSKGFSRYIRENSAGTENRIKRLEEFKDEGKIMKTSIRFNRRFGRLAFVSVLALLLCLLAISYLRSHVQEVRQEALAKAVNDQMIRFQPLLNAQPSLESYAPVGKNVVWWSNQSDACPYHSMIDTHFRSAGIMQSFWGGGFFGAPRFEELNSIIIVKAKYVDEKVFGIVEGTQSWNRVTGEAAFSTYRLEVWVVEPNSFRTLAFREFPAVPLLTATDYKLTDDRKVFPMGSFLDWKESLQ
jgi:hypothetical protein